VLDTVDLPFYPKRIYWIYSVTTGQFRGNHAHKKLKQFFWLVQGSVRIDLSNRSEVKSIFMRANSELLVVNPGLWRKLYDFSSDAIVMVGADSKYDPDDYIRDWDEYLDWSSNSFEK
jgi:dTDP-4-dehydrorhamnose 3,5-epimerase-like enzyme